MDDWGHYANKFKKKSMNFLKQQTTLANFTAPMIFTTRMLPPKLNELTSKVLIILCEHFVTKHIKNSSNITSSHQKKCC